MSYKSHLSVIIPHYASPVDDLLRMIDSSEYVDEIIVVDDQLQRGDIESRRTLPLSPKIRVVYTGGGRGPAYARNLGVSASKGQILLFIDDDVRIDGTNIELMLKEMLDSRAELVVPRILFTNGQPMYPRTVADQHFPYCSAVFMIRARALGILNELFDETYFLRFEDTDFFERCRIAGMRFKLCESAVANHAIKQHVTPRGEKIFYWNARNLLYGILKFRGVKSFKFSIISSTTFYWLLTLSIEILFNLSVYEIYHENVLSEGFIKGLKILQHARARFPASPRGRRRLFSLLLQAMKWNLRNLELIRSKRKDLQRWVADLRHRSVVINPVGHMGKNNAKRDD